MRQVAAQGQAGQGGRLTKASLRQAARLASPPCSMTPSMAGRTRSGSVQGCSSTDALPWQETITALCVGVLGPAVPAWGEPLSLSRGSSSATSWHWRARRSIS